MRLYGAASIGSQLHDDAAIDGITLHFSGGAAFEDGGGSTKGEDIVDPLFYPEIIEL